MLTRCFGLFLVLVLTSTSVADAGRCWRRSYHSISSSRGWSHGCYSCHKAKKKDTGWQDAVATIAEKQNEYSAFLEALKALGFSGATASASATAYAGRPYADQGATVYGYPQSLSRFTAQLNVDPTVLMNQSARLTQNAQTLSGQAKGDFDALIATLQAGNVEVAKILASGHAAGIAITAAQQAQGSGPAGPLPIQAAEAQSVPAGDLDTVVAARCSACHNVDSDNNGFVAADWLANPTPETTNKILARITHADPGQRMPKAPDGPGTPLTIIEIKRFFARLE